MSLSFRNAAWSVVVLCDALAEVGKAFIERSNRASVTIAAPRFKPDPRDEQGNLLGSRKSRHADALQSRAGRRCAKVKQWRKAAGSLGRRRPSEL